MRGRFGCKSSGVLHRVSGSQYPTADRVVRRITMRDGRFLGSVPTASRRQTACTRKHSQPGLDRVAARTLVAARLSRRSSLTLPTARKAGAAEGKAGP